MANIASPSHSPAPALFSFPQNPEEFDADPRVSFSKLDQKFILETEEGQEFEFDDGLKRWVPVVRPHPPTIHEGRSNMAYATYNSEGGF
jgi:HIV Tat-specific factor 1